MILYLVTGSLIDTGFGIGHTGVRQEEGGRVAGRITILVIDDNADARRLLEVQLAGQGFRIVGAADEVAGLALARSERPAVIFLDLMMPRQDGLTTYQTLRQDPAMRSIPVIFLSALSMGGALTKRRLQLFAMTTHGIRLEGPYEILGKPYESEDLLRQIHRLLPSHRETARPPTGPRSQSRRVAQRVLRARAGPQAPS